MAQHQITLENIALEGPMRNKILQVIMTYEDPIEKMKEVVTHGCQSGTLAEFVYYKETIAFFEEYKLEINEFLSKDLEEYGYKSPYELFREKWNEGDPLCLYVINQNLLCWYAVESVIIEILNLLEIDW